MDEILKKRNGRDNSNDAVFGGEIGNWAGICFRDARIRVADVMWAGLAGMEQNA